MAIVFLLMSLLGGITGVGVALYFGLGWTLILGTYVLGGMIGSMISIAIAVAKTDTVDAQHHTTLRPAA